MLLTSSIMSKSRNKRSSVERWFWDPIGSRLVDPGDFDSAEDFMTATYGSNWRSNPGGTNSRSGGSDVDPSTIISPTDHFTTSGGDSRSGNDPGTEHHYDDPPRDPPGSDDPRIDPNYPYEGIQPNDPVSPNDPQSGTKSGGTFWDKLGTLFDSLVNRFTGAGLTGAEKAQNTFNAMEAEKDRQFQSTQADITRDWQEEMYNKYNSPAAMMSQYRDAGINPMLVAGGTMPQMSMQSPTPAGAQAAGSVGSGHTLDLVGNILSLIRAKAEIQNIKADTRQKNANAEGAEITNNYLPQSIQSQLDINDSLAAKYDADTASALESAEGQRIINEWNPKLFQNDLDNGTASRDQVRAYIGLLQEQVNETIARTGNINADTKLKDIQGLGIESEISLREFQKGLIAAQTGLTYAETENVGKDTLSKAISLGFEKTFGTKPNSGIPGLVMGSVYSLGEGVKRAGERLRNSSQYKKAKGFVKNAVHKVKDKFSKKD